MPRIPWPIVQCYSTWMESSPTTVPETHCATQLVGEACHCGVKKSTVKCCRNVVLSCHVCLKTPNFTHKNYIAVLPVHFHHWHLQKFNLSFALCFLQGFDDVHCTQKIIRYIASQWGWGREVEHCLLYYIISRQWVEAHSVKHFLRCTQLTR